METEIKAQNKESSLKSIIRSLRHRNFRLFFSGQSISLIGGMVCIIGAFFFARRLPVLRELARPIYVKMGIIPEIATGIQSATETSIHRNSEKI